MTSVSATPTSILHYADTMMKRAQTRVLEATAPWRLKRPARQIAFIHVPKTGGTSMASYIRNCVGAKRSGRTVVLRSEYRPEYKPNAEIESKALKARYCTGHASWSTFERVRRGPDTFMFTILRDPRKRLWSLYNYLHGGNFSDQMIPHGMLDLYSSIRGMTPVEFFVSPDPRLRILIDNAMVRQLGGGMELLGPTTSEGDELVQKAKRNLSQLQYVGFTETFENDFARVLAEVDLPPVREVPHVKVSQPHIKDRADKARVYKAFLREAGHFIEPLIEWDLKLYDFAVAEFGSTSGKTDAAAHLTGRE